MTDLFFVGSVNKQVGTIALLGDLRRTPSLHNGGRDVLKLRCDGLWTYLLARVRLVFYNKYYLIRKFKHGIYLEI